MFYHNLKSLRSKLRNFNIYKPINPYNRAKLNIHTFLVNQRNCLILDFSFARMALMSIEIHFSSLFVRRTLTFKVNPLRGKDY
jgi:hypothetical protein